MEYNRCMTCGAGDGRAGNLIDGECLNCHDTRKTGDVVVHANLNRTEAELKATMAILTTKETTNTQFLSAAGFRTETIRGVWWWCIPSLNDIAFVPVQDVEDYSLEYLMKMIVIAAYNCGCDNSIGFGKSDLIDSLHGLIAKLEKD